MGHLTLLAEDVISALERYPADLQSMITACAPQPEWDEYVKGRYSETKQKDRCTLGGPKPNVGGNSVIGVGGGGGALKISVDEGEVEGREAMMAGEGSSGGRMIVDEGEAGGNAMFPGLRLDESAMDGFRSRQQQQGIIEIEQGDIEGRRADLPEDVGPSGSGGGSGGGRGQLRRVGSVGSGGREVRNTADFGSLTGGGGQDDSDSDDEDKYGNSRTTHVSICCRLFHSRVDTCIISL